MSAELVKLGQEALAAVANGVAVGAPLVKCQLLASEFYEALRNELKASSQLDVPKRNTLTAALTRCERTAIAITKPDAMLEELRSTLDLLRSNAHPPEKRSVGARPVLRVIEGGRSG
jgi:hypothetical protein